MLSFSLRSKYLFLGALTTVGCGSSSSSPPGCDCPPGQICVAGRCEDASAQCPPPPPAVSAAAPPLDVIPLGTHKVGDAVSFDAPEGLASVTIIEQVVDAAPTATFDFGTVPNGALPLVVTDPTGTLLFEQFRTEDDPTRALLFSGTLSAAVGALTFPNTTAGLERVNAGEPGGRWQIVVSDTAHVCNLASNCAAGGGSDSGTYDVTVIVKPGPAAPPAGIIDLTFNLVSSGAPGLSAATAASDADLQRMVGSLAVILARANVALGAVSFVDVPPAMAARVATGVHLDDQTVCSDMAQLFASAPPGRQVNVFLVPAFITGDSVAGTTVVGVDGAVPGPATVSPTPASGVAVSTANLRAARSGCSGELAIDCGAGAAAGAACCGADVTAFVAAHEIGHFLGLYHVTESSGLDFDPLADTPTCSCQSCAANPATCANAKPKPTTPHRMSVSECTASSTCGGGDNLMFWLFGAGSAAVLTDEQQQVIRANPAVY